jgi:hypothetical protein
MNDEDARWPRLKLGAHSDLDWHEVQYTAESLENMADAMRDNPHPIQTRTADGLPGVWDLAIEKVLRALAANSAALKAMNHRRPTPPARIVGLNRAVHFRVRHELHPEYKTISVWLEVGKLWDVSSGQVKDDVSEYKADGNIYRSDDAVRIVQQITNDVSNMTGRMRLDVLKDFDADMNDRAAQLRDEG